MTHYVLYVGVFAMVILMRSIAMAFFLAFTWQFIDAPIRGDGGHLFKKLLIKSGVPVAQGGATFL